MDDKIKSILLDNYGFSKGVLERWDPFADAGREVREKKNTIRIARTIGTPSDEGWDPEGNYTFTPKMMADFLEEIGEDTDCRVILNTGGGSIFGGVEICALLNGHRGKVTAEIVGLAASMGAEIALACDEIEMAPGSTCMMHAAMTIVWGNAKRMRQAADMLDEMSESSRPYYEKRLDKELVDQIMSDGEDHWYNCESALEIGFADRVTEVKGKPKGKPKDEEEDDEDEEDKKKKTAELKAECVSMESNRMMFARLATGGF